MKKQIILSLYIFLLCSSFLTGRQYQNDKIISDYYSWIDSGKLDEAESLLTNDFKAWLSNSTSIYDKKGIFEMYHKFKTSLPDMNHEIINKLEFDNKIIVIGIIRGTNTKSLNAVNPKKNDVALHFTSLFEMGENNKIRSLNMQFDNESYELQLMSKMSNANKMGAFYVKELFHTMDSGDTENINKYCSNEFTISSPFFMNPSSIHDYQTHLQSQKVAFPDMKTEITDIISEGKRITTKAIFRGTNTGIIFSNQPTGNKVEYPFITIDEFDSSGKIKTRNVQFDVKLFETQLLGNLNTNNSIEKNCKVMEINSMVNKLNMFITKLQE